MNVNLTLGAACAIFDDLASRSDLTAELAEVREQLRPYCSIELSWRPHGPKSLPCIHGRGWAVIFNDSPSDSDAPETSLHDLDAGPCYVLTGDHRAAFERVAGDGFKALKQVYDALKMNPEYRNECSEDSFVS